MSALVVGMARIRFSIHAQECDWAFGHCAEDSQCQQSVLEATPPYSQVEQRAKFWYACVQQPLLPTWRPGRDTRPWGVEAMGQLVVEVATSREAAVDVAYHGGMRLRNCDETGISPLRQPC